MRDILYDFRRTFTGRFTIVASLIIILVAVGTAYLVTSSGLIPATSLDLAQVSFSEFGTISGTLIPILATLSSYFYYGKDKANDVLESVLVLPVTRGRLIFSRFIANVSSMLLAFAIGVGVYQLILYEQIGTALSYYYVSYLIWVYLVEIVAYTGLLYLASQFLRTQGAILGTAVLLFLFFGIFWIGYINYLVLYAAHIQVASNAYVQYHLIIDAFSPGGYAAISVFLFAPTNGAGALLDASQFGVTPLTVGLLGVTWLLTPILLAIFIGRKRD